MVEEKGDRNFQLHIFPYLLSLFVYHVCLISIKSEMPLKTGTVVPPYPQGYVPRPQWMPETTCSTEPHIYYIISCTYLHFMTSLWQIQIANITTVVL